MSEDKPKNIDEYKEWLKEERSIESLDIHKTYYESVTNIIKSDFAESACWKELTNNFIEYNDRYFIHKGYPLFTSEYCVPGYNPKLLIKPFDSFLLKTFRINVINNELWPNPLIEGWVLPDNWYTKINDIIRTCLIVKYLDGVDYLINIIQTICGSLNLSCNSHLEAREEGYYAAHLYTKNEFEVPCLSWDTNKITVSIEIQITTQLQEVIKTLLHKYYEERRKSIIEEDTKWQWNYKSDEFAANYLGHILHYIEGMIMEIREKQKEGIK
jgi:hypothetical protein